MCAPDCRAPISGCTAVGSWQRGRLAHALQHVKDCVPQSCTQGAMSHACLGTDSGLADKQLTLETSRTLAGARRLDCLLFSHNY